MFFNRRRVLKSLAALPLLSVPQFAARAAVLPADGPIVSRYGANASNGKDAYRPRGFAVNLVLPDALRNTPTVPNATWKITNAGSYAGWDIFAFGAVDGSYKAEVSSSWATFTLDRPAVIGYVHRDTAAAPSWLATDGWVASGTINAQIQDARGWQGPWPVYRKSFPAGIANIKSPAGWPTTGTKQFPYLLFAEADGTPSAAPSVPAGLEVPVPNQTCPTWVHDQYKTSDGFPTWHAPVDAKYWCYFRHDHGTNPILVNPAITPRYGQVAALGGMTENHWGHKGYGVQFTDARVYFLHHFGTWGLNRANTCLQQFHLVEVHAYSADGTVKNAVLRFMADYGRALGELAQDGGGDPINPATCPNGNAATGYTTATPSRQIPMGSFGLNANEDNSYEPWNFPVDRYKALLGIVGNFVFNTTDPLTTPTDTTASVAQESTKRSGTGRFFTPNNFALRLPTGITPDAQGFFYTDAMATMESPCGGVQQYWRPGFTGIGPYANGSPDGSHRGGKNTPRWGDITVVVPTGEAGDFEDSIRASHGPN